MIAKDSVRSCTCTIKVLDGVTDMILGGTGLVYLQSKFVDFSVPVFFFEAFWAHRYPVPKRDYIKVTKVFSYGIWAWLFGSVFAMSAAFALLHSVYLRSGCMNHLVTKRPRYK